MIPNWLKQRAYLTPQKTALSKGNKTWTFEQVYEEGKQYAERLTTCGITSGDRVALMGSSTEQMVFIIYGALLRGVEMVMLNHRLTTEELQWQIEDAGVTAVIYEDQFEQQIPQGIDNIHSFSTLSNEGQTPFAVEVEWNENRTMTIMYTSGTTGFPKGVRQTAQNHTSNAMSSVLNLGLSEDDCWLCTMPLFHISGFSILVRSLLYGMTVRLYEKFDAKQVATEIVNGTVTRMSVVTVMLQQILLELEMSNTVAHPSFKTMLAGGGSIPTYYLHRAIERKIPILQTYGMTETSSQTATLANEDALRKIGSAGKPLFFNQIKIRDTNEPNMHGEVLIKGPHVTPGYIGRFEHTSPLEEGWLPTGDIGYLDEEGYLYIVDRRSDLIISGGENVYPAEIENVLSGHPLVQEVGVCGKKDDLWGESPVAFVVVKEVVSEKELLDYCKERLAKYKVPTTIFFTEQLPRNASNKLLRRELKQWLNLQ